MPYFKIDEALSLFYTTHGDVKNPPILLIHGWGCDSQDYMWQIPFLSKTHYVIAYDHRGHGLSSAPKDISYKLPDFISDAKALLKHLNIEKAFVVGHSMGGITASTWAATDASMLKGVALIDPPYWIPGALYDNGVGEYWQQKIKNDGAHAWGIEMYGGLVIESTPEFLKTWYNRRIQGVPDYVLVPALLNMYEKSEDPLPYGREEVINEIGSKRHCPRLVVFWQDEKEDKERALGMGELDHVETWKDVGHWPHQEQPERFNKMLGDWLAKIE